MQQISAIKQTLFFHTQLCRPIAISFFSSSLDFTASLQSWSTTDLIETSFAWKVYEIPIISMTAEKPLITIVMNVFLSVQLIDVRLAHQGQTLSAKSECIVFSLEKGAKTSCRKRDGPK